MKPEQMRIVIAEACGAKWIFNPKAQSPHRMLKMPDAYISHSGDWIEWGGKSEMPTRPEYSVNITPNYPECLNACHEMEKVLTDEQWIRYREQFLPIMHRLLNLRKPIRDNDPFHATAIIKCEAFIKTVCPEKWEE
jgi:hypothetical protein